jgi:hypothetical protein
MALARRHSRRIHAQGRDYVWHVRRVGVEGCPDCDELRLVIADASRRGSFISVRMRTFPNGGAMDIRTRRMITPGWIRALIDLHCAHGWQPGEGVGPFELPRDVVYPACPEAEAISGSFGHGYSYAPKASS